MERLIDGYYTISDQEMYDLLSLLNKTENIKLEPSALSAMVGAVRMQNKEYLQRMQFSESQLKNGTHVVWATGGGMVPEDEMKKYLSLGN
ncbi:pyridoxal-phosphate dependent enzyme [Pasteurella bettyae]|uniref:D-serine ammonia-lyase n=2 Tax=Pasteurella bettyae TaxID=752 RepID=I3D8X7_9PAST|nr:pyridoxal-phosphate dependent enzyme [Pasteurella bettyae]EIJ68170.1 hypothetical protein HMPREF1052_1259 [Pasteurella bettyae CCUG 2042]SUB22512.1 D-serine dehydratase [Pasteurella bettyae]